MGVGGMGEEMPPSLGGTLSPFIPLSLRAFKGEGERRTEAYACAMHMRMPLVQYWGEGTPPQIPRGASE